MNLMPSWGADGRIYFLDEDGRTTVVKAGPVFEALAASGMTIEQVNNWPDAIRKVTAEEQALFGIDKLNADLATALLGMSERPKEIAVPLPQVHPVRAEPLGQAHVVIDDEGDVGIGADALERFGQARQLMLADILDPQLEGRGDARLAPDDRARPSPRVPLHEVGHGAGRRARGRAAPPRPRRRLPG